MEKSLGLPSILTVCHVGDSVGFWEKSLPEQNWEEKPFTAWSWHFHEQCFHTVPGAGGCRHGFHMAGASGSF